MKNYILGLARFCSDPFAFNHYCCGKERITIELLTSEGSQSYTSEDMDQVLGIDLHNPIVDYQSKLTLLHLEFLRLKGWEIIGVSIGGSEEVHSSSVYLKKNTSKFKFIFRKLLRRRSP
jgi:hypothetical protein